MPSRAVQDIGLANLDVIFGVKAEKTLLDVLRGSVRLDDIIACPLYTSDAADE